MKKGHWKKGKKRKPLSIDSVEFFKTIGKVRKHAKLLGVDPSTICKWKRGLAGPLYQQLQDLLKVIVPEEKLQWSQQLTDHCIVGGGTRVRGVGQHTLQTASGEHIEKFEKWLDECDKLLKDKFGLEYMELPDQNYSEMFEDGYSPEDVVEAVEESIMGD